MNYSNSYNPSNSTLYIKIEINKGILIEFMDEVYVVGVYEDDWKIHHAKTW